MGGGATRRDAVRAGGVLDGSRGAIRFRLHSLKASVHDFSSKFGVGPDQAVDLVRYAVLNGFIPVLTFHPGSQCTDPQAWARHIEAAAFIARKAGIKLAKLNVGGGFPSRYAASRAPRMQTFFDAIRDAAGFAFGNDGPALECEPGRALCAPGVSLQTRVKLVRRSNGDLFLNDGIYGGLMEVSQAPDLMPFYRVIRDGDVLDIAGGSDFTVFGPTCDPLDVLPHKLRLPAGIREDDVIEFASIGAYGMATSTRFNGYGEADLVEVGEVFNG